MSSDIFNQLSLPIASLPLCAMSGSVVYGGDYHAFNTYSPIDGVKITSFVQADSDTFEKVTQASYEAHLLYKVFPAPLRGAFVKRIGELVKENKEALAYIITLEAGKIEQEALGEVQEWIDICDFAVGLSRQLYGLTMASERANHRLMETWHPLGVVGVISAFNFPMAVWAWNAMLAFVCGDSVVLKPSNKAPLCALACQHIVLKALADFPQFPQAISSLILGDRNSVLMMANDKRYNLVSATGSIAMGKSVSEKVGARLGRSLLELSGNNALIVTQKANIENALKATTFSAVGTTGQRCTSLRRLIIDESLVDSFCQELIHIYKSIKIGDPRDSANLMGPLIDKSAYEQMQEALQSAVSSGGEILYGGERTLEAGNEDAYYVKPAIVKIAHDAPIVQKETFAPILYVLTYTDLEQAITIQNSVTQGLSSAIFTDDMREAELFIAQSDCGIANINIGTSGAEIGGAFGGEKETGGGRESGSDAWKNYMRRATNTINYGSDMPLSQGISFDF